MNNSPYSNDILCPICKNPTLAYKHLYDDRFGYEGEFCYRHCSACGLFFHTTPMDEALMTRLYSDYYPRQAIDPKMWKPAVQRQGFKGWLIGKSSAYMYVPPKKRVLDIGCGTGEALGYHKARGCDTFGCEMDVNAVHIARLQDLEVSQGAFDPAHWPTHFFDVVTLDQVLEHNQNPLQLLSNIKGVLKRDGELIITTPNANSLLRYIFGERWIHWHPPYHCMLYTKKALHLLLKQAGYRITTLRTVSVWAWLMYQWIHLGTCPPMGTKSSFWDPRSTHDPGKKGAWYKATSVKLNNIRAFAWTTRFFDALGCGDNFVLRAVPC